MTPTTPADPEAKPDATCSKCKQHFIVPELINDTSDALRFDLGLCGPCFSKIRDNMKQMLRAIPATGTDTPETDAQIHWQNESIPQVGHDESLRGWCKLARRLEADRNALRGQVEEANKKLKEWDTAYGSLAALVDKRDADLAAANAALAQMTKERDTLRDAEHRSNEVCLELMRERDAANAALEEARRERDELRDWCNSNTGASNAVVAEIHQLRAQLDAAKKAGEDLKKAWSALELKAANHPRFMKIYPVIQEKWRAVSACVYPAARSASTEDKP